MVIGLLEHLCASGAEDAARPNTELAGSRDGAGGIL